MTQLENDPMKLDREVDWVIKHKLIEGYRERNGLELSDAKVALLTTAGVSMKDDEPFDMEFERQNPTRGDSRFVLWTAQRTLTCYRQRSSQRVLTGSRTNAIRVNASI